MIYKDVNGSIRRIILCKFSKQAWPSGKHPVPPSPEKVALSDLRQGQKSKKKTEGKKEQQRAPEIAIALRSIPGNHACLPPPGTYVGYTKESCILRVIGKCSDSVTKMPENNNCRLKYDRGGSVIEMSNTWLLFIDFQNRTVDGDEQTNCHVTILDAGRNITCSLNPRRPPEGAFLENLRQSSSVTDNDEMKTVLFVRCGNRGKYLYCGECRCVDSCERLLLPTEENTSVVLTLVLVDFDVLLSNTEAASEVEGI
mmetsp:Transcript_62008/g.73467  ORF Transcript_62008/g.73467 Transcript_62008/m.73467 type:complete len:255 (-) Transcript_62008:54-818(-)